MFGLFDTLCDALGDIKDAVSEKLEDKIESLGEKIVQKVEGDSVEHTMKDKFFVKMRKIGIADDEIERRWQSLCCESSERQEDAGESRVASKSIDVFTRSGPGITGALGNIDRNTAGAVRCSSQENCRSVECRGG